MHESAHEFSVNERRNLFHVESGCGKKIARFFHFVNARRLDVYAFKARAKKFVAVFKFLERACDAANPEFDTLANVGRNFAAHDNVGNRESPAGLQNSEG